MINHKLFIALLLTGSVWFISCDTKKEKQEIRTGLELSAQPGGIIYLDTTPTIHVSTTLFNPTNDTMSFVSMSCSYEDMFLADTSAFKIQSRFDCFRNFPVVVAIPPHSKLDQFIMVRPVSKDIKAMDHTIKIGMYYLTPKKENGFAGIIKQYENRQKAKILWSNELDLKRLYRKIYQ